MSLWDMRDATAVYAAPGASPYTPPYNLTGVGASQSIELHLSYPPGGEARLQVLLALWGHKVSMVICLGRWSRLGSLLGL